MGVTTGKEVGAIRIQTESSQRPKRQWAYGRVFQESHTWNEEASEVS